ncbi:MAG: PKD domain-containing protein [Planctomycetota bacterium]
MRLESVPLRALTLPLLAAAALLPAAACPGQSTLVLPRGLGGGFGNSSNAFPWGNAALSFPALRVQTCYDSSNFTLAGVTAPIRITRLAWRANDSSITWTGGTFAQATVALSTAAVDHAAVTQSFAQNHGADVTTVYSGPAVYLAGTGAGAGLPGRVVIDLPLQVPFLYDPQQGDLIVDVEYPGGANYSGGTLSNMDVQTGTALASRVYSSTLYPLANGTTHNHGAVVEVEFLPANGLFAAFTCDPPTGPTPLAVHFTDTSYSSAPGGVQTWAWDFDNDGVVDSTAPSPVHVFTTCGNHTVTLTVGDGVHAPSTRTEVDCVVTDHLVADFTWQALGGNAVLFTDTSTPPATTSLWDLDGDGAIDANGPVAVWNYPPSTTPVAVTLQASRLCAPASSATRNVLPQPALPTTFAVGNGLSGSGAGNAFELEVRNPAGVNLTALTVCPYSPTTAIGAPIACQVWITDAAGGAAAHHADGSRWRLLATASGTFQGAPTTATAVPTLLQLDRRTVLPPGSYGLAVHLFGCGIAYSSAGPAAPLDYGNADVAIRCGLGKSAPFAVGATSPRVWNGILHYDLCALGGLAGDGFFASGCDSSLGVPVQQTRSGAAVPGQTLTVAFEPVPHDAAFLALGISNTTSPFGPLPIDLSILAAPGCALHQSLDETRLLLGSQNRVSYGLPIPNDPTLLCVPFYVQALVPDPPANGFGWVLSDAAAVLIGL